MQTPQMQMPAVTHTLDTSAPMDIYQSWCRPEMCTCYNCGDKGHLSCVCQKPQKQRIWLANLAEGDIKSIVAEDVAAAMDTRELANKSEQAKDSEKAKQDFQASQWWNPHPIQPIGFHY